MYQKVKDKRFKDYDPQIIAWQRESHEELLTPIMKTFPELGDNIKKIKYFAVKDYEKVLLFDKGMLVDVLNGGVYLLSKKAKLKGTEIVWIDSSILKINWSIPKRKDVYTNEGFQIGLNGDLNLRINDAKIFYKDIVAGKKVWVVQNLKEWIDTLLLTSLRDIIKSYSLEQLKLEDRERIISKITAKVAEEFSGYGLSLETFNVIGLEAPEGYVNLEPIKSITRAKDDKEDFDQLIIKKQKFNERIKELE